jgi:ribosomal protein S18 acetylase RimI-like enzyme
MNIDAPNVQLRHAADEDEPFLRRLHREAMGPHVEATWGSWNDDAQAERFAKAPVSQHQIIVLDGHPIGCLLVLRERDVIVLSRIWIAPAAQRRGIGTRLILQVCEMADKERSRIRLRVLRSNPARRLYERLGFEIVAEMPTHFVMERAAVDQSGTQSSFGEPD